MSPKLRPSLGIFNYFTINLPNVHLPATFCRVADLDPVVWSERHLKSSYIDPGLEKARVRIRFFKRSEPENQVYFQHFFII